MIQLSKIDIKIPKNYVLVEIIDDTDHLTIGDVDVKLGKTKDGLDYEEGEHSVRRGYLRVLPNKITYDERGTPWKNNVRPKIGNIVYFDYLSGKVCEKAMCNNKVYYILPYRSLILHLSPNMDIDTIEMLNGFILAQNIAKKQQSTLEFKEEDYKDRFEVKRVGERNVAYSTEGKIDDKAIQKGSQVLTLSQNYPILEADFQLRLDGNKYVYFQRETVIGLL